MTRHRVSLLAGIATIALAVFPAEALELNAGGIGVNIGGGGGGGGLNANVNVGTGGGAAGGGGGGGGGGGANLPGGIGGAVPSLGGAPTAIDDGLNPIILPLDGESDPTTADVDVDLDGEGEDSVTGSVDTGLGDVDAIVRFSNTEEGTNINAGTDVDAAGTSTEAMVDLTIGGGGVAGEATVGAGENNANLSINIGTGGVLDALNLTNSPATTEETAAVPATPGTGVAPSEGLSLSASAIQNTFETISEEDVAALKVNCRTILGNSASYSANAVAICKLALGM